MIKVNGEEINFTKFPNNETLVDTEILNKYKNTKESIKVEFKFFGDVNILNLYFVLSHLNTIVNTEIDLYIYYMPYSRMDREQNGNCFTLRHIKNMISSLLTKYDKVFIVEPHSDISLYWCNNILGEEIPAERINVITPIMDKILMEHPEIEVICYPDAGAMKRFRDDSASRPVIYCNKVRDFNTGEIKGLELVKDKDLDLKGKDVLILDDLSSKGGTFYHTACELKKAGANKVYLGICHCENTIREGSIYVNSIDGKDIFSPIEHIYCTDSMLMDNQVAVMKEGNMTIFDIEKFLETGKLIPNTNLSLY